MVAVIMKPSDSIRHTLNYNENKVTEKVAELIHAVNYPKDADKLTFNDKVNRLKRQAELNSRVKKNSVHITLSFDPSEKHSPEVLRTITEKYMEGIGYNHQPYLVYEHRDTSVQHVHIVTTNVQANGIRISSNNIGKDKSENIRLVIEKEFHLVPAQHGQLVNEYQIKPVNPGIVNYGKAQTKKQIQNVLQGVLDTYRYSSFAELNAILQQYNVLADRGTEDSRAFIQGGLVYRALENGKPVGIGIKASLLYNKPTVKYLQEKFILNSPLKQQPYGKPGQSTKIKPATKLRNAIDLAFKRGGINSVEELSNALKKDNIHLHVWQNENGLMYGMTFVDHNTKCVFNGRKLGDSYSAHAIQQRCTPSILQRIQKVSKFEVVASREEYKIDLRPLSQITINAFKEIVAALQEDQYAGSLAYELRENERKRKKKRRSHHL